MKLILNLLLKSVLVAGILKKRIEKHKHGSFGRAVDHFLMLTKMQVPLFLMRQELPLKPLNIPTMVGSFYEAPSFLTEWFTVGRKVEHIYFMENIHIIIAIFILVMLFKSIVIYGIIRRNSDKNTFAKMALAGSQRLTDEEIVSFLILINVISMILTPFTVNNIYKFHPISKRSFTNRMSSHRSDRKTISSSLAFQDLEEKLQQT